MEEQGHWEWRGFGGASPDFLRRFTELPLVSESSIVEDFYLWAPGLDVNTKIRSGAQSGLKFKRFIDEECSLEKWLERPTEIFSFPLAEEAWKMLANTLGKVNVELPEYPPERLTPQKTLEYVVEAGVQHVRVEKERETRLWEGPHGGVEVEWVSVSAPQPIISIGLENREASRLVDNTEDDQLQENVHSAFKALGLEYEPLHVMSYMEAIEIWAGEEKI